MCEEDSRDIKKHKDNIWMNILSGESIDVWRRLERYQKARRQHMNEHGLFKRLKEPKRLKKIDITQLNEPKERV